MPPTFFEKGTSAKVSPVLNVTRQDLPNFLEANSAITLDKFLKEKSSSLDIEKRLQLAAKLFFQLYKLHTGWASTTSLAYKHFEVSPTSFHLDTKGHVLLIPGMLCTQAGTIPEEVSKPSIYRPDDITKHSADEIDIVGLRRTVHLPEYFFYNQTSAKHYPCSSEYCQKPCKHIAPKKENHLLSTDEVYEYKLEQHIDTAIDKKDYTEYFKPTITARRLALASIGRQDLASGLSNTQIDGLMTLLHAGCLAAEKIESQLTDNMLMEKLAKLSPICDWLKPEILQAAIENEAVMSDCLSLAAIPCSKRHLYVQKYNRARTSPAYLSKDELFLKIKQAEMQSSPAKYINEQHLLSFCVAYNLPEELNKCLVLGADPNQVDDFNYSPLMDAAWLNKRDCYLPLLRHEHINKAQMHPKGFTAEMLLATSPLTSEPARKEFFYQEIAQKYSGLGCCMIV